MTSNKDKYFPIKSDSAAKPTYQIFANLALTQRSAGSGIQASQKLLTDVQERGLSLWGLDFWWHVFYSSALWVVCHRIRHCAVVSRRNRMGMCGLGEKSITPFGSCCSCWLSSIITLHPEHLKSLLGLLHISHSCLAEFIKIEVLLSCLIIKVLLFWGLLFFTVTKIFLQLY